MKKIILPGLVIGVVTLILGMLVSFLFMFLPSVSADYNNPLIMRQWTDPLMILFFIYPFLQGFILAWAWDRSKRLFKGTNLRRGIFFGLAIFLIATIPGMFVTYATMPYTFMTIVSWTFSGLVNALVAGLILVKMNK